MWVHVRHRLAAGVAAIVVAAASLGAPVALPGTAQPTQAAGVFADPWFRETAVLTGLNRPISVRFADDGRVFVAEKAGVIKEFDSLSDTTPTTVLDIRSQVNNYWDRGLMGIALDPDFTGARPYLYVYYVYDAPPGQTAPIWNDTCPNPPTGLGDGCVVTSKLAKYTVVNNVANVGSRVELLHDWCQQAPSHSGGGIAFGDDGALYLTGGDGASFSVSDYGQLGGTLPNPTSPVTPINPCSDPITLLAPHPNGNPNVDIVSSEGGALRSQDARTPADPQTLGGTVIRIDPDTGAAWPTNPWAGDSDPNRARVVAYGLRNPFRMSFRPGTDELYLAEVGFNNWEEFNRVDVPGAGGTVPNYGWPCYEGTGQTVWSSFGNAMCDALYTSNSVTSPFYTYSHSQALGQTGLCFEPDANGRMGGSPSGVAFYEAGGTSPYPARYDGAMFFVDYSRLCMGVILPGPDGRPDPTKVEPFQTDTAFPVDLTAGPGNDIYYVDHIGGRIMRVSYLNEPVAVATANPISGVAPLEVTLDGSDSYDPAGPALVSWEWDVDGNGEYDDPLDTSGAVAQVTLPSAGTYTINLRVTSTEGRTNVASVEVDAGNAPPVASITTPTELTTWSVGETIPFSGTGLDPEDGSLPPEALHWEVTILHCSPNCHAHLMEVIDGVASGSFVAPDHEYPSQLTISLTVTDSDGASHTDSVTIDPETATLGLVTHPAGIQVPVATEIVTTPGEATAIKGGTVTASAPLVAVVGGIQYRFAGWTDGGQRVRDVLLDVDRDLEAWYLPDAFDTCATAATVAKDTWLSDRFGREDDVDWFRFTLGEARTTVVTLGDLALDARLELYAGCSTLLATSDQGGPRFEELVRSLPAGTYNVRVAAAAQGTTSAAPYALRIRVMPSSGFAIASWAGTRTGATVRVVGEVMNLTGSTREAVTVTADFRNSGGTVIASLTGQAFLTRIPQAGVSPFELSGAVPTYSTVTFRYTSLAAGSSALPTLVTADRSLLPRPGRPTTAGIVTNTSTATAKDVRVMRAWYGPRGQVIDVRFMTPSPATLAPGASGSFSTLQPGPAGVQAQRTYARGRF